VALPGVRSFRTNVRTPTMRLVLPVVLPCAMALALLAEGRPALAVEPPSPSPSFLPSPEASSALAAAGVDPRELPQGAGTFRAPFDPPSVATDETEAALPSELEGEIVVDLRDDVTEADVSDIARVNGIVLSPNSPWSWAHDKLEDAHVEPGDEARILDALSHDPRVEHAEAMSVLRASFVPDDPLYDAKQWHLKRVGAERAWDYACGRGVTVAVIDTGVACWDKGPFSRGSDLAGTRCERGYDFVNDREEAADDHGHGTHVAGTIAQTTNNGKGAAGLAFCASLMPIKVLTRQGWGTVANVAEGIRFAADEGAQVINLSLGGPIKSRILEDAVAHAIHRGVVVVAAAGNSGRSVGWPAAYDGVVAVSASDSNDKIAWFSSRGPEVAIAAPGVAVTQQTVCDGGKNHCEIFGTFNGTSMAAPHVAGAAALLLSTGVTDPDAVRAALAAGATPKDDASLYGAGILSAGDSVAHAYARRLGLRLVALIAILFLVSRRIRSRGGEPVRTALMGLAALVGAVGLVPVAPYLGLLARAGALRPWVELLARPLGEWDMAFGVGLHRWLPLAGALPVVAAAALFFGIKRLRPAIGGLAMGTAALATQMAISGDAAFAFGSWAMRLYAVASVGVCLWVARIALDGKRA
jgi:serine protease